MASIRLTNAMRDAFVNAAMADVPHIDYVEQIRSEVNKQAKAKLKELKLDHISSDRLNSRYCAPTLTREKLMEISGERYMASPSCYVGGLTEKEVNAIAESDVIRDLLIAQAKQEKTLKDLRNKLKGAIMACSTREQAVVALPEFEKYLPANAVRAITNPIALANVVAEFSAAGWPKDEKKPAAKPAKGFKSLAKPVKTGPGTTIAI